MKKLNKKLGSAIAVGGIVVVGFLAWKSHKSFEDGIVASTQQLLLNTAKAKAESIETSVSDIQGDLDFVAGDPRTQDAAANNKSYEDVISTEGYSLLEAAHNHLAGKIHALYRLDAKGMIQSRIPWDATRLGDDYSSKPGVEIVIETHKPCVSELLLSNSGQECFSVCYPIFKEEQFVGVIRAAVHLSTIQEMAKRMKVGEKGHIQIIDDDGRLLAHPIDRHVGKDVIATIKEAFPGLDWLQAEEIVKEMKSGETGVGIYYSPWWDDEEPDVVKKLTAFAPIRFGNELWSLGAVMAYEEVSAPVKAHTRNITAGSLLLILVFVTGGVWLYNVQKDKIRLAAKAQSAHELLKLNSQLAEEIVAHKQAEVSILNYQVRLKAMASHLSQVQESERHHLSMQLHDRVSQRLVMAKFALEQLAKGKAEHDLRGKVLDVAVEMGHIMEESYSVMLELSNPILHELGLVAALRALVESDFLKGQGMNCKLVTAEKRLKLDDNIRITVYQAVRELLINVAKHAKAKNVELLIERERDCLEITVKDDGIGFEPLDVKLPSPTGGFGLLCLRESMEGIQGELKTESKPGQGAVSTIRLPLLCASTP